MELSAIFACLESQKYDKRLVIDFGNNKRRMFTTSVLDRVTWYLK